ncbi:hypothetical protein [Nocardia carnea]|uniref:Helix-turn-helix domain-containing protein n=1 Tax=Nocardia carnea TaxID=37328 RepID=A0ABW7TFT9_9NOCA|nr:hypothetical protein [Nocardia carnea]
MSIESPDPQGRAVPAVSESDIAKAVAQLTLDIHRKCDELAGQLLNEAAEQDGIARPVGIEPLTGEIWIEFELTKLRIRHQANVDLELAAKSARSAGATWVQIGSACGVTRQAAYDRWGKRTQKPATGNPSRLD